jgi:(p)ppGpp synthase/HD superfamily hydrolase
MGLNRPCGIDGRDLPTTGPHPLVRRNGKVELLTREEIEKGLQEGRFAHAFNPDKGWEYTVAAEVFDERAEHIYRYESQQALARIERSCQSRGYPNINQRKAIFQRVETAFIQRFKGKPKNLRHVSFMLRELSEVGCDFIAATAVLLHNFPRNEAEKIMLSGQKTNKDLRDTAKQILTVVQRFYEINGITYSSPPKKLQHHIQNFMDALIKISQGNGRALLLFLIHKLSSLSIQTEDAADITFKAVEEFVAPSAERLGLVLLASKLRNEAFRLHEPQEYEREEAKIVKNLGMPRKQAESRLEEIQKKTEEVLAQADCGLVRVTGRVKTPWGAKAKSASKEEYRIDDYSDILLMEDLLACRGVTKEKLGLAEAKKLVRQILGENFGHFNDKQTETKYKKVGDQTVEMHHITAILDNGDSIEFQFMTEEAYKKIERGYLSHWAYKLELLTGQQFDRDFLEECAREMNGDILNDAEVIYRHLQHWVYVYFQDPRYKEEVFRVIRREVGSIPLDVVHWIIGKDISTYAGIKIRKIWDKRFDRSPEDRPLEDGDLLELLPFSFGRRVYLTPLKREQLIVKALDPITKELLRHYDNPDL